MGILLCYGENEKGKSNLRGILHIVFDIGGWPIKSQ
jgi:hypothetical protein